MVMLLKSTHRQVTATQQPPERHPVWYSGYKFAGYLRHVALFVGRNKYEIREDEDSHGIRFETRQGLGFLPPASTKQLNLLFMHN